MQSSVLVVGDDDKMQQSVTLNLKRKGYQHVVAATGQAALDLARHRFFDVAFVDIQLSDMQWIDLSACLKELHPDMEVLLITGYAWRGDSIQPLAEIATTRLARSKLRPGTDWEDFSQNEP